MSWLDSAREVLDRVEQTQTENIARAAAIAADSIGSGSVMFAAGTGHSRIAVEELFPRYGSFPGFYPLVELSTTFHTQVVGNNGQRQAMFLEKVEGLAAAILANFALAPPQSMILFSASGQNAVAIELAVIAREAGLPVVGVTSLAEYGASKPRHSSGLKLADVVDVVIDLCSPVGDSLTTLDGLDTPVGPSTTLSGAAIVNLLKVEAARLLIERGQMPSVLTSTAVVGPERSSTLFEDAYLDQAERSAAVLATRATRGVSGVLVAGSGGGIGGAVLAELGRRGVPAVGVDRDGDVGLRRDGDIGVRRDGDTGIDITRPGGAEEAVAAAAEQLGGLTGVVHAIGMSGRRLGDGPITTCTDEAWTEVHRVNHESVFRLLRAALPAMSAAGGGSAVVVGSGLARTLDEDFLTVAYASAKGALVPLVRSAAFVGAATGVRVNLVSPGVVDTPMARRAVTSPDVGPRLARLQPVSRGAQSAEAVAKVICWVLSEDSGDLSGADLPADGGWTLR